MQLNITLTRGQADIVFHSAVEGLESCDMNPKTDCTVCKDRVGLVQQLVDLGFRAGLDYREVKEAWGIRDESLETQKRLFDKLKETK